MAEIRIEDPEVEEDRLADYEQLFRTVFDKSDEGIIIAEPDVHGQILEVNDAAAQLHGYLPEEMLKLRVNDLHLDSDEPEARKAMDRMLQGEWIEAVHDHRRKDGTTFDAGFRAGISYYKGRRVLLSFVRDVTREKQNEQDLAFCQSELASKY